MELLWQAMPLNSEYNNHPSAHCITHEMLYHRIFERSL